MRLPPLSHLQFVAMDCIIKGRKLRDELAKYGKRRASANTMLTDRLADDGYILREFVIEQRETQGFRVCKFQATPLGVQAYQETLDFYRAKLEGAT